MRLLRSALTACALTSLVATVIPAPAQTSAAPATTQTTTARDVEGTWQLVAVTVGEGEKKQDLFGPSPKGQLVLGNGRFTVIYTRADIPKYQANNRSRGTAAEYQATVQGSVAYFGAYAVESGELILKVEGSTFPNWVGETQNRKLKLSGDDLAFETPPAKNSGAPTVISWKRLK